MDEWADLLGDPKRLTFEDDLMDIYAKYVNTLGEAGFLPRNFFLVEFARIYELFYSYLYGPGEETAKRLTSFKKEQYYAMIKRIVWPAEMRDVIIDGSYPWEPGACVVKQNGKSGDFLQYFKDFYYERVVALRKYALTNEAFLMGLYENKDEFSQRIFADFEEAIGNNKLFFKYLSDEQKKGWKEQISQNLERMFNASCGRDESLEKMPCHLQ